MESNKKTEIQLHSLEIVNNELKLDGFSIKGIKKYELIDVAFGVPILFLSMYIEPTPRIKKGSFKEQKAPKEINCNEHD